MQKIKDKIPPVDVFADPDYSTGVGSNCFTSFSSWHKFQLVIFLQQESEECTTLIHESSAFQLFIFHILKSAFSIYISNGHCTSRKNQINK